MIEDNELIATIRRYQDEHSKGIRLRELCEAFDLPYQRDVESYTPEARALALQLQRLRKVHRLWCAQGQRWEVREK